MSALAFVAALGSAVFNGSYIVPAKSAKLKPLAVEPMVFQMYCASGVFVSSLLVIPFFAYNEDVAGDDAGISFAFSPLGVLGGIIFVMAMACSFLAVNEIGLALGQGVWGGAAIVVSYLWGVVAFGETPRDTGLSVFGLLTLVLGVVVIAFSERIAGFMDKLALGRVSQGDYSPMTDEEFDFITRGSLIKRESKQRRPTLDRIEEELEGETEPSPSAARSAKVQLTGRSVSQDSTSPHSVAGKGSFFKGMVLAILVGVFGGSVLVPLHYVPSAEAGLVFLPSFGIGALGFAPLTFVLYCYTVLGNAPWPPLHFWDVLPYGLVSGSIFTLSNLLSICAIPSLGYGVAYPILQCAIFVSGMWGIYYLKELTDPTAIRTFFCGGVVLIGGASLLAAAQ